MKKLYSFIAIFVALTGAIYAQTAGNSVQQIDNTIKTLATDLNRQLVGRRASIITMGPFTFRGGPTPFGSYWVNQLTEELANLPNKTFSISSGGTSDLMISGEVVMVADIIRVYTRLISRDNMIIISAVHTNIERDSHIMAMLSSSDNSSYSSSVFADLWEPDDFDNLVPYDIGVGSGAPVIERTFHYVDGGDDDFFLLLPDRDGLLVIETIGGTDTYMELYDADTLELLAEDDDDGSDYNARINYSVRAGKSYVVKVRGYDSSSTGSYSFRAYF